MAKSNNHFKAGLFIVVSAAVALAIFFGITGSALLKGKQRDYTVAFDLAEDVSGLAVGSEVRIGGVKVGTVRTVDVLVDPRGAPTVKATFRAPERYALKQDAVVTIQSGLTGTVNLNVTNLGIAPTVAAADFPLDGRAGALTLAIDNLGTVGAEVKGALADWRPRVTNILDDARPRVSGTLDQVRATAATADATLKQARAKIDPGYEKYAGVADATRGAMSSLDDILGDGKGDIRKTLANVGDITDALRTRVPTVMDKLAADLDALGTSLEKTGVVLDEARAVATNAKEATAAARSIVGGNRGRIDEIIKSATFASQNLAAASTEIRSAPWRLLYRPSEDEVANQNLYDATRQLAEASRKLQDSAQALRDTAADPRAEAAGVQAMLDKLNADFANYQKVETTLWERVRK